MLLSVTAFCWHFICDESLIWSSFLTSGAIKRKVELDWGTEDMEYLQKVELHSEGALNEVRPDIIIYNAGTDILDGDPLGGLAISPQVQLSFILPFSPPYQICTALTDTLFWQGFLAWSINSCIKLIIQACFIGWTCSRTEEYLYFVDFEED